MSETRKNLLTDRREHRVVGPGFRDRVYAFVREVPSGWVTTYGDVAGAMGSRRVARQVGFALAALFGDEVQTVPWHRVINASGRVTIKGDLMRADIQRRMLEAEGVQFDKTGRVVAFQKRRHAFTAGTI